MKIYFILYFTIGIIMSIIIPCVIYKKSGRITLSDLAAMLLAPIGWPAFLLFLIMQYGDSIIIKKKKS